MFGGKKNEERVESSDRPVVSMPAQKETPSGDPRTQIGSGTVIKGEITIAGDVQVCGTVQGLLTAAGSVDVQKGGEVKADVRGKSVRVAGRVEGKIYSGDKVHLLAGAHVKGDIHSQSLKIDEGVFFQGACVMGDHADKIVPMPLDGPRKAAVNEG
jgi:cytoskeletal protein CcmA (bactofilin family)